MVITEWVAIGGLFISTITLIKSFFSDKKLKQLDRIIKKNELYQQEKAKIDGLKANVEVNVIETGSGKPKILRFYNKGQADAFNISFEISSDEKDDYIRLNMPHDYLPYPKLLPFQSFEVKYFSAGLRLQQSIHISWDDSYSKGRSKDMVVDM